MDPDATLKALCEALVSHDEADARECTTALRDWLARGGFAPKWREVLEQAVRDKLLQPRIWPKIKRRFPEAYLAQDQAPLPGGQVTAQFTIRDSHYLAALARGYQLSPDDSNEENDLELVWKAAVTRLALSEEQANDIMEEQSRQIRYERGEAIEPRRKKR